MKSLQSMSPCSNPVLLVVALLDENKRKALANESNDENDNNVENTNTDALSYYVQSTQIGSFRKNNTRKEPKNQRHH